MGKALRLGIRAKGLETQLDDLQLYSDQLDGPTDLGIALPSEEPWYIVPVSVERNKTVRWSGHMLVCYSNLEAFYRSSLEDPWPWPVTPKEVPLSKIRQIVDTCRGRGRVTTAALFDDWENPLIFYARVRTSKLHNWY